MSLIASTAWTAPSDVCYAWHCTAGPETFHRSVEQYLDALLLPDYTDEEIRREVCHVGPVVDETTGRLTVDEKGTIYQEMVATYEKRGIAWYAMQPRVWGPGHPFAWSQGGEPSALRTVTPRHVREFHATHYHLGAGAEMIVALPDWVPEAAFLARLSQQMQALGARPELASRPRTPAPVPPARPEADRSVRLVPYPSENEDDTGLLILAWAPVPLGAQEDRVLAELFLATIGNGQSATLFKRLMDRATREVPVDAAHLEAGLEASPIDLLPWLVLDGLPPRHANAAPLGEIVTVVRDEIRRVAAHAPRSQALASFNDKALGKLVERERALRRQLDAPPLFGHRGGGGFWLDHLRLLDMDASFARSVTLEPVLARIRAALVGGANPWTRIVREFGLSREPYVTASVASRAERERRASEKAARIEGHLADLATRHGGDDVQETLARFAAEYERTSADLDAIEQQLGKPRLAADVPLVLDPSLVLDPVEAAGVSGCRGVFDTMTFAEASVCLRLDGVPADLFPWLAVLPSFLVESGVIEDGRIVPYDQAEEQRAREIHSLSAEYAMRPARGRHELRITASGAGPAEARRAVEWIGLALLQARLDLGNIDRLRDLVAQAIRQTRGRLGGAEEHWVDDPAAAIRWQRDPLYLASSSLHARLLQLARCEWRLMDAPSPGELDQVRQSLETMARTAGPDAAATGEGLDALLATLERGQDAASRRWAVPVIRRCRELVGDMAPSTIARDLGTLAEVAARDLARPLSRALAEVGEVRDALLARPWTRFVLTGSRTTTDALLPRLAGLFAGFRDTTPGPGWRPGPPLIDGRLRDHEAPGAPVHYGLVNAAGASGVFVHSAKAGGLDDLDDATLIAELAGRVFAGAGAHSFFMKTWGAGLAYSNGLRVSAVEGRVAYYAERCPDLAQVMSFVTGLVRDAATLDDAYLAECSVANAVTGSRAGDEYEDRTRAAADDMTDGDTPGRIERYRRAVLALRERPGLWESMKPRVAAAAARVLPGIAARSPDVAEGVFLTIGPEPMLARWEKHLLAREGERVHRVYGRDFWMFLAGEADLP
jgi:hypothetical protein